MTTEKGEDVDISLFLEPSFQFNGGIFDYGDHRSSFGFVELLGFQDLPQSLFELPPPAPKPDPVSLPTTDSTSETATNFPTTPNSSSISSSSDEAAKPQPTAPEEEAEGEVEIVVKEKKQLKETKKKGQKRPREPRVAFMTKSEVDHLEDGYRWRKYGQKAVKNSPFPRSYYRCTAAACGVKKRVERSVADRTVVVTTYEGQHTHPSRPCRAAGRWPVQLSMSRFTSTRRRRRCNLASSAAAATCPRLPSRSASATRCRPTSVLAETTGGTAVPRPPTGCSRT
ncbi:putative WRKY transcription factor 48 [Iris pallida]|uniref:WRKY transcription factor 48 n=1 Tax=Iris pallida TaxID=29817 RepID=A0AAX6DV53_IRIPA|nr:putative WRKY transcription factor 48 [Iris pallida]